MKCVVDGRLGISLSPFDYYAWQSTEDDLDTAMLIDATLGAVDVGHSDGYAFDRGSKFREFRPEFPAYVLQVVVVELHAYNADVGWCSPWFRAAPRSLFGLRYERG